MKVALYCRFSSEGQRDGYSIEAQLRALNAFCDKNNYQVVKEYIDEARSGTSDDREEFQKMISESAKKEFEAVVVHKLDRFARERYDAAIYRRRLNNNKVQLISVLEPLDGSPEAVIMEAVYEGLNEYYSKNLSREVKKGKNEAVLKKQYVGGNVPFGFRIDENKKYQIVPEQAKIVRELFDKISKGTTLYQTAKWAVKQGYRNTTGNYINIDFLRRMVKNPIYAGVLIYGKEKHRIEDCLRIDDFAEAIIDPTLFWDIYNEAMKRKQTPSRRVKTGTYILTGYLYCDVCKSHLKGYSRSRKVKGGTEVKLHQFYQCANKVTHARHFEPNFEKKRCSLSVIKKEVLEDFVINQIQNTFFNDESLEIIANLIKERLSKRLKETQKDTKGIELKISSLRKQEEKLLDLYLNESLDKESYIKKSDDLVSQRNYQLQQLNQNSIRIDSINLATIKKAIQMIDLSAHSNQSLEYKELLLSAFVNRIFVTNDTTKIIYKIPLPTNGKGQMSNGAGDRT